MTVAVTLTEVDLQNQRRPYKLATMFPKKHTMHCGGFCNDRELMWILATLFRLVWRKQRYLSHLKERDIIYPIFSLEKVMRMLNHTDRKSTRLNSSHVSISYAVFCLKKKNTLD